MCKSRADGGQRCYSHARKALDAAYAAHRELEPRRTASDDGVPGHVESALQGRILRAQLDLASTPQGRDEFRTQAAQAQARGNYETAAQLAQVIERGELIQERNAALADQTRNRRTPSPRQTTSTMQLTTNEIREYLTLTLTDSQANAAGSDLTATLGKLKRSQEHRARITPKNTDPTTRLMLEMSTADGRSEDNRRAQQGAALRDASDRWHTINETPDITAPDAWRAFIEDTRNLRDNPPSRVAFTDNWRRDCNFLLRVCGEIAHEHTRPRNNVPDVG